MQKVDRFFPSSKRCHVCHRVNAGLQLSDREWTCAGCGTVHQRDRNAAKNIEQEGVRLLAGSGSLGVTLVEFAASTPDFGSGQVADEEASRTWDAHL